MSNSYTKYAKSTLNPTIGTDAYQAGDVVGGLLQFDVSALTVNGGIIYSVQVVDDAGQEAALVLHLFGTQPTTIADDAAFAPSAADLNKRCSKVDFSSYDTFTGVSASLTTDVNDIFMTTTGVLYGYLVCTATPTYVAATDLHITVRVMSE